MPLDAYALPPAFADGEWIPTDRAPEIEFRCKIPSSLNGAWQRAMGAAAYKQGGGADMDPDEMYSLLVGTFWAKFVVEARGTDIPIPLTAVPGAFPDLAFEIFDKARAIASAMESEGDLVGKS